MDCVAEDGICAEQRFQDMVLQLADNEYYYMRLQNKSMEGVGGGING